MKLCVPSENSTNHWFTCKVGWMWSFVLLFINVFIKKIHLFEMILKCFIADFSYEFAYQKIKRLQNDSQRAVRAVRGNHKSLRVNMLLEIHIYSREHRTLWNSYVTLQIFFSVSPLTVAYFLLILTCRLSSFIFIFFFLLILHRLLCGCLSKTLI